MGNRFGKHSIRHYVDKLTKKMRSSEVRYPVKADDKKALEIFAAFEEHERKATLAEGNSQAAKECPVCSNLDRIRIEHPSEMLSCIEMIKELISSGNFEKIKSNFELESPKTEEGCWQDDVMYYSLRCKNCGQEFLLCCETYHGSGGSFSRRR